MSHKFLSDGNSLCSSRLFYREITWEDTPTIIQWRSNPTVYRYFKQPHAVTLAEHTDWFERYTQDELQISFLICIKKSNYIIGNLSLCIVEEEKSVEISYLIGDSSQCGNGYATEAVAWASAYAKKQYSAYNQFLTIHQEHKASIRVAEKNGYVLVDCSDSDPFLRFKKPIIY